jgi:predicted DCC family thiol-disulfide oxidoreductase YuxK
MTMFKYLLGVASFIASVQISTAFQPSIKEGARSALFSSAAIDQESPQLYEPVVVAQRVFESDKRPVILFDGVCNLCNGAVNLALDWDPKGRLRFSALQSNVGRALLEANGKAAGDISSIVLVTQDGAFVKSDAVLKITEELMPLSLLPLKPAAVLGRYVVPKFLRDIIYDGVADNRYDLLGKRDVCRFDSDGEFEDRFVNDDIALRT